MPSPQLIPVRLVQAVSAMAVSVNVLFPLQAMGADRNTEEAIPPASQFDQSRFGGVRQKLHDWNVVVGAGALIAPKFEGSDEFKVWPIPFVSATFGDRVAVDPRGVTLNVYETHGLSLGARVGYDLGRQDDDSDHLKGLGDIDAGGVVGATIAYKLSAFEFYTSVDKIIGGSDGLQVEVGANASHTYNQFIFSSGVSATWADKNYMSTYFGVTPRQSVASGLAAYEAGAGFKRVDFQASVTYMATDHWMVRAQGGVGYLLGDAADSPIVQEKLQPFGMLTVGYKF